MLPSSTPFGAQNPSANGIGGASRGDSDASCFCGAIGVAGVEPPGKGATADTGDHACAMAGYNAIKDQLK